MEIRPTIIGPDLSINSDIAFSLVDEPGLPVPGILGGSWETVLLIGEYHEIALGVNFCFPMVLKGMTGSNEVDLSFNLTEDQCNLKGSYAGVYGSYFIYPIEGGYWIKGNNGKAQMDMRINTMGSFSKVVGDIAGKKTEINLNLLSESIILIRGNQGDEKIDLKVSYTNEGIIIKGAHGKDFFDYTIVAQDDRIVTKGITSYGFIKYEMILESNSEIRIKGKPGKLETDYLITVYENGASIKGDTGFYKADYVFVVGETKE